MTIKTKFYYEQVYEVVQLIPKGKVSTYGHIADFLALGSPRMVGYALSQLKDWDGDIPAYRVVNAAGVLSGRLHFASPNYMAEKLEAENIVIKNNKVQNFEKCLWIPADHIL
ncbi:MGMT family protein [Membranihabitans marinus]|uniref:MGMT family protein n=1 Tax=Membranihabitans marinus TaxID=1227546 RepID=UPI001F1AF24B|nr:MGMT family protein [Membranihabitans marinus]